MKHFKTINIILFSFFLIMTIAVNIGIIMSFTQSFLIVDDIGSFIGAFILIGMTLKFDDDMFRFMSIIWNSNKDSTIETL